MITEPLLIVIIMHAAILEPRMWHDICRIISVTNNAGRVCVEETHSRRQFKKAHRLRGLPSLFVGRTRK